MKKYVILATIIIIAITSVFYLAYLYKTNNIQAKESNKMYENLYNKSITGNELASIVNKTLDKNEKNNVKKNNNGYYINNDENSIIIEIKFKDSDEIFKIEQISKNGIENFIKLYSNFYFTNTYFADAFLPFVANYYHSY